MRKALIIGINNYLGKPLSGCENDATSVAGILEKNGDGSPNFDIELITSEKNEVTSGCMHEALNKLFQGDADMALFYFAGHGIIDLNTNAGHIVSQDGKKGSWGVSLSEILGMANRSNIKSKVIILDSCNSGFIGEISAINNSDIAMIGTGVTILTACHRDEGAEEINGHGIFTNLLLDGLSGSASDIRGDITPAALYSHIDQTLGPWEQRPIYKANVKNFVKLRKVTPKVPDQILRKLPIYFPNSTDVFSLDPSYESDRTNVPNLEHIPIDAENVKKFKELQMCNRHSLIVPVDAEHMYNAAVNSTSCRLTGLGAHYRKLAELGRI